MSHDLRLERLEEEYDRIKKLASESTSMQVIYDGDPPEKYAITFAGTGFMLQVNDVVKTEHHKVVIRLGVEWPLHPPVFEWQTPIFHPNIRRPDVCIQGKPYSTLTHLDMIIETLWKMLTYQIVNIENYYNKKAALWAEKNKHLFPCDNRSLRDKKV